MITDYTIVPAMDRDCDETNIKLLSVISIIEYSITLQYKQIFIKNENWRILYCQIFPKTEPPVVVVTVTIDCYFVLFIPFSLFTHLRQGRKMEILKAGCFYFTKISRNRLIIFGFSKFNQSILRGIYLFWTAITTLRFSIFDRLSSASQS